MTARVTGDERLTILVDLRVAQYNGDRGIPAYAQSIVRQICRDHPGHRYLFLWDERLPQPPFAAEFRRYGGWHLESSLAQAAGDRIDVLFTACFFLPLHGRGGDYLYPDWLAAHQPHRLGIVYDLIPYLFPERYLSRDDARRSYLEAFGMMRGYDRLFAISQATRSDAIRLAGIDPRRIVCVYGDIDHRKRTLIERGGTPDPRIPQRHGLRSPYCVYVGGDDWRKNVDGMIEAFALFHAAHPGWRLAVVCKMPPDRVERLQALASSRGLPPGTVVFTGYVSDADMIAITRQADMMAYPSLYEGLGLPVLEAHGCGVPVVGSNVSSIRELLIPELACDPRQPAAVAATMGKLLEHPQLRAESVAFGRRLLGRLGWRPAAAAVMAQLHGPPRHEPRGHVAVVGVLPPARTAIAPYTLRFLQSERWRTDFFEANDPPLVPPHRELLRGNRLFPAEILAAALARGGQDTVLFVLGNSAHHAKTLRAMMQTRLGCRQRRLAYLHDTNLSVLLRAFLGAEALALPTPEASPSAVPWIRRALEAAPEIGRSLRFLAHTAELDGVLVNSQACADLIRSALGPDASRWTIDTVMLPIEPELTGFVPAGVPAGAALHVGTFGTGGDSKRLEAVAKGVAVLARRRPVRLSVAGWAAARQCERLGIDRLRFVEIFDEPDDRRLDDLMRQVDVAVQLRVPTHGESSGAVARLLGLGKRVVVTAEGSFVELPRPLTSHVRADCTPPELAAAIASAAERTLDADAVRWSLEPFTAAAFAGRFAAAIGHRQHRGGIQARAAA